MSEITKDRILRLAPGCRLSAAEGREDVLLFPEGALRLKGPSRPILELCDGKRTLGAIVEQLQSRYPSEDTARIEMEAVAFLTRMRDRGVLEEV